MIKSSVGGGRGDRGAPSAGRNSIIDSDYAMGESPTTAEQGTVKDSLTQPPTRFLEDPDVTLWHGDALETLRQLPAGSVDCVVTSPPYWGLRDYATPGQLGLEETPELFVESMVAVFREVRRVLADHGTAWVNMGDSFLPGKQLAGGPWKLAFALQDDGWILRSDIVWSKPNPMPESVTDRPTKAHEYLFLLAKRPRYFFDQEAVREKYLEPERMATRREVSGPGTYVYDEGERVAGPARGPDGRRTTKVVGQDGSAQHRDGERWPNPTGRNVRSVWEIATQPYPEAHFATFPEELARRCVLAGCPEWVCRGCGRPRERIVAATGGTIGTGAWNEPKDDPHVHEKRGGHKEWNDYRREAVGWSDCGCGQPFRPGYVLDPFVGSGTVPYVARLHGRHAVGVDLSADYLKLAARRLQQQSLFAEAAS